MPVHRVQQGDCLARIAKRYGFADWRTIYDHADNADLRAKRKDPHVLSPGDEVHVPEKKDTARSATTGKALKFRVTQRLSVVRLRLADEQHRALGGKKYRLTVGDKTHEGKLDAEGKLEHEVDPTIDDAELKVWLSADASYTFALKLGHLDPVDDIAGVQGRLTALKYLDAPITGILDEPTRAALRTFQRQHVTPEEEPSGELDSAARDKLTTLCHG